VIRYPINGTPMKSELIRTIAYQFIAETESGG